LTEEDRRRILKERARTLAVKDEQQSVHASEVLYVFEFTLQNEQFAFDTKFVREVIAARKVATVPCTPPFISGVLNLRGEIITVLDTKRLFGFSSTGVLPTSKIIIVSDGHAQVGYLVDAVVGVTKIVKQDIQPPPATISGPHARYIAGVTNAPLILVDFEALSTDPGIIVEEEVE
jgi:purine-binding chemotaxis protein CheW